MSQDGLRVHHAELENSADRMDQTFARVQDALTELQNNLDPLVNDWSGQAREAYLVAKNTWNKEMEGMANILTQTSNAVRTANGDYMTADKKGSGLFGGG